MAKATKGPGKPTPINPIAAMVKEALKRREEAKMSKMARGQGVAMSESGSSAVEKNWRPKQIEATREIMAGPSQRKATSSRAEMIKEGFFTEKNGDLVPTKKYEEYKKSGKLTGKYNIQ